ncbi:MAG: SoxR reducing system RseC family protein [Pseudomonadota bacterium]
MTTLETHAGVVETVSARSVTVRIDAAECPRCAAGVGCGAGLVIGRGRQQSVTVAARGSRFHVGDRVRLRLAGNDRRRAILLLFAMPIVGLVGAGLVANIWFGDIAAAVIALGAFVTLLSFGAYYSRRLDDRVGVERCEQLAGSP